MRKVKLEAWGCSVTFGIDDEVLKSQSFDVMTCVNGFLAGGEDRLYQYDGNVEHAALSMIAAQVIRTRFSENYHKEGIIIEFNDLEGYPALDGSKGITLLDFDELEIGDFEVGE